MNEQSGSQCASGLTLYCKKCGNCGNGVNGGKFTFHVESRGIKLKDRVLSDVIVTCSICSTGHSLRSAIQDCGE